MEFCKAAGRYVRKIVVGVSVAVAAVVAAVTVTVPQAMAVMSPSDVTATTTGISDALALFYTIGGSILVVCAAIWGFGKVKGLLGK